jgi:hypothetical protein
LIRSKGASTSDSGLAHSAPFFDNVSPKRCEEKGDIEEVRAVDGLLCSVEIQMKIKERKSQIEERKVANQMRPLGVEMRKSLANETISPGSIDEWR